MTPPNSFPQLLGSNLPLAVGALLLVVAVRFSLSLTSFKWTRRVLESRLLWRVQMRGANPYRIKNCSRAIGLASKIVPKATCLTQALALQALLKLCGKTAELRLGVSQDFVGTFDAHAWLELDGEILIGNKPGLGNYSVLPQLTRP